MNASEASSRDFARAMRTLHGSERLLAEGEVLYDQGEASETVFVVEAGYIKLTQVLRSGTEHIIAILNAGELLVPASFQGLAATQTAAAKGEVRVYAVPLKVFQALIEREPHLVWPVFQRMAQRRSLAERRLQASLSLDVRGRLALTLYDLVGHYGGRCVHGHDVDVPLTQQEMADMVGASRQVVSVQMNALRKAGILSYTRQFICVEDMRRLAALADQAPRVSDT